MEGTRDKRRAHVLLSMIPSAPSVSSGGRGEWRGGEMISKREIWRGGGGGGKKRADVWEFGVIAHDRPCECNLIVASDAVNATAERGAESTNDKKKSA